MPPAHPAAPAEAPSHRADPSADGRDLAAILRWRARALASGAGASALASRALPLLFHASFPRAPLDRDPPGVAGVRYRPRWLALSRALGLPPPNRARRAAPLVAGLVAVPTPRGVDALALVAQGAEMADLAAVQERLEAAQRILRDAGAAVQVALFDPRRLARDGATARRVVAFGALVAGALPGEAARALQHAAAERLGPTALSALAAGAPTPFSSLALGLLGGGDAPGPLEAVRALAAAAGARRAADIDAACARWASGAPGAGALLEEALALWREPARGADQPGAVARVLEIAGRLILARARSTRASRRLGGRDAHRAEASSPGRGVPSVLIPALGRRLAAEAERGRLSFEPVREDRAYAVRLRDGTLLGRGAAPAQARVRAVALVAAADAAQRMDPLTWPGLDAAWRVLAQRLARAPAPELLLVVDAGPAPRPGPPFDPLNRGRERSLEFEGALAVVGRVGSRPSARMLTASAAVAELVSRAARGTAPEVLAACSEARPVATRLAQIAALLRDGAGHPVAVEAGGRVLLPGHPRPRSFTVRRFGVRPRLYTPDPDAPDLAAYDGRRSRWMPAGVVHCRVTRVSDASAALLFTDGAGGHLREEVPLAELEDRLADARLVLSAAGPPSVVTVGLADDLEPALRRLPPRGQRVEVVVQGELPWIGVEVGGERFGGPGEHGWSAAAQALLARWPPHLDGRLALSATSVTLGGRRAPPLLALWASSVARRRLALHLERVLHAYRAAAASRREV